MSWIIWVIIAVVILFVIGFYNAIIVFKNRIKNAWAQIDVQLKRRNDLIPNLINTVKGYMKYEKGLLNEITKARTSFMNAKTVEGKAKASNVLSESLKSIFAVAENYPNLKANENFKMLQEELSGTENKIAYARQFYNDSVMSFNIKIQKFPYNILAGMFSFKDEHMFKAEASERKNVKVEF